VDAAYVTGKTAIISNIGSNQQIIYRDVSGITGATHLTYNKLLPSLTFGINNQALSIDSAIIGGNNNYVSSGNTGSIILGGNNIILSAATYCNTTVVPNLAIWNTPAGSGNILAWNNINKKVYLVSGGTGGGGTWGTITGVLSGQTDLQNALNDKVNTITFDDFTGTTAPNTYETIDGFNTYTGITAPLTYLGINACASDSAKLNNKSASYYLNTGSTVINSLALCGCIPSCFLDATATVVIYQLIILILVLQLSVLMIQLN
jgi:hypothetical protein